MSDPAAPLWRAAQVFRLFSWVYAGVFFVSKNSELDRPVLGMVLFGVLTVWSVACAAAYLRGFGRNRVWVLAEVAVVVVLMASTPVVASAQWTSANQAWPTTLWATNAVVSSAILAGPVPGMVTGLIVMGTAAALKGTIAVDLVRTPTILIELAVGLAVGMAASDKQLMQRLARAEAALRPARRRDDTVAARLLGKSLGKDINARLADALRR